MYVVVLTDSLLCHGRRFA